MRQFKKLICLIFLMTFAVSSQAPVMVASPCASRTILIAEEGLFGPEYIRVYDRYHVGPDAPEILGEGFFGVVHVGEFPGEEDFSIPIQTDLNWKKGDAVAVKVPNGRDLHRSLASFVHEAYVAAVIADNDPKHLFARTAFDSECGVLVVEYRNDYIPLTKWLKRQGESRFAYPNLKFNTPEAEWLIIEQLDYARQVLVASDLVHGDLTPNNVLLNPLTNQIMITDYSLAAFTGGYPPYLNRQRGAYSPFHSQNQKNNGPAEYKDDETGFDRVAERVRTTVKGARGILKDLQQQNN